MKDTRLFFFVIPPDDYGHLKFYGLAAFHDAGFLEQQGEGWEPISHTLTPHGNGGLLLSVMAQRDLEVPGASL